MTLIAAALPVLFGLLVWAIITFGQRGDEAWLNFALGLFYAIPGVGLILVALGKQRHESGGAGRIILTAIFVLWVILIFGLWGFRMLLGDPRDLH